MSERTQCCICGRYDTVSWECDHAGTPMARSFSPEDEFARRMSTPAILVIMGVGQSLGGTVDLVDWNRRIYRVEGARALIPFPHHVIRATDVQWRRVSRGA